MAETTKAGTTNAGTFTVGDASALVYGDRSGDDSYFVGLRPDVKVVVPAGATRILDVGCGAGRLGASLKAERDRYVAGIELHKESAALAATVLDKVICGSVAEIAMEEVGQPASFDCIIFADILEHLLDPWGTLRRFRTLLAPGGVVVASIPNIGHITIIMDLLRGRWHYRERGLLDQTHLRFFTRRSIEELFRQADLEVVRWEANYRLLERNRRYQRLAVGLAKGPLKALLTYQYRVVASAPHPAQGAKLEAKTGERVG